MQGVTNNFGCKEMTNDRVVCAIPAPTRGGCQLCGQGNEGGRWDLTYLQESEGRLLGCMVNYNLIWKGRKSGLTMGAVRKTLCLLTEVRRTYEY